MIDKTMLFRPVAGHIFLSKNHHKKAGATPLGCARSLDGWNCVLPSNVKMR